MSARTIDYTRKQGLLNEEFLLPADAPEWARILDADGSGLDFVEKYILATGMVADWGYHDNPGNPHIQPTITLRPPSEDGFGSKGVAVVGENGQAVRTKSAVSTLTT